MKTRKKKVDGQIGSLGWEGDEWIARGRLMGSSGA